MAVTNFGHSRPTRGRIGKVTTQEIVSADTNEEAAEKIIGSLASVMVAENVTEDWRFDTGITGWKIHCLGRNCFVHYAYEKDHLKVIGSGATRQLQHIGGSFDFEEAGQINITHPLMYDEANGKHILYNIFFCATNSNNNLQDTTFAIELYQAPGT